MSNPTKEKRAGRVSPITLRPRTAAALLDVHYDTLHDLISRELFSILAPRGRGPGKPIFLFTDEVEMYAMTRDEDAVRDLRIQKKRLKPRRK